MGRVRIGIAVASLAAAVAVGVYLPWAGRPDVGVWSATDVEVALPGVEVAGVSEAGGRALVQALQECAPVGLSERLERCEPAPDEVPDGSLSWKADGGDASATWLTSDTVRVLAGEGSGFGPCEGQFVVRCPAALLEQLAHAPLGLRASDPALQGEPGTLRAHADMLSRIVREAPADTSWLDDLDAMVEAGGEARFIVPAEGDALGWRVEGAGETFDAALREVAVQRFPSRLFGETGVWTSPERSAIEVVLGEAGWVRIDALRPEDGSTVELGRVRMFGLIRGGEPQPAGERLWLGSWWGANGPGATVMARRGDAQGDEILFLQVIDGEAREHTAWWPREVIGATAADCVQKLTSDRVAAHEARLAKAFAELGADGCLGIRHRETEPGAWFVEIAAP